MAKFKDFDAGNRSKKKSYKRMESFFYNIYQPEHLASIADVSHTYLEFGRRSVPRSGFKKRLRGKAGHVHSLLLKDSYRIKKLELAYKSVPTRIFCSQLLTKRLKDFCGDNKKKLAHC